MKQSSQWNCSIRNSDYKSVPPLTTSENLVPKSEFTPNYLNTIEGIIRLVSKIGSDPYLVRFPEEPEAGSMLFEDWKKIAIKSGELFKVQQSMNIELLWSKDSSGKWSNRFNIKF